MKVLAYIKKIQMWKQCLFGLAASFALTACDGIYDDEGDCSTQYSVQFVYDRNMNFADGFAHAVKRVSLYAFDESGRLVYEKTEAGSALSQAGYRMNLNDIEPGTYDFLVWAEGAETDDTFTFPDVQRNVTQLDDLTCYMNREQDAEGNAIVDHDLVPLFHGIATDQDFTENPGGERRATVYLTKNTNVVRIVLQHLSGETVNADDFEFTITDDNGWMAADNSLLDDETLTYHAWSVYDGEAALGDDAESEGVTSVGAAIAELTVGRLMTDHRPILTIRNKSGETVLSIPLIDYCLLVKGNYNRAMDDQEYLDRQDEYNMVFFLDENNRWVNSTIYINSWKVVLGTIEV